MHALTAAEIRERFLSFFEQHGHKRLPSDSLVPANDPTLLFTGAGMNQFKDMFLGKGSLPWRRVTTAQKCLRVPDLDNVGRTPRHHTFFEMLGNFSFGDYFKLECIAWEWEFFTRALGIPPERLVATVYVDDDEAFAIWRDRIGLTPDRIYRFGEKENFWPAEAPSKGPNGPCGPCSEIYFDARPAEPLPARAGLRSLPDDRFTEIGNCVFTQYDRQPDGTLSPLPQRNIDVGLGLERITAVLAGAPNNFETDLFRPYLRELERRSHKLYGRDRAVDDRMRRIADHLRAVTFCIADGARPANEGRGYVVRKILRRAVRDGFELGIDKPYLHEMVDLVAELMGDAYPELREHGGQCRGLIRSEEESFAGVYRQGMARLEEFLAKVAPASRGGQRLLAGSGGFAFELHDTYGFPVDITRQVMAERGCLLDEEEFERAMDAQRERARAASATTEAVFATNVAMALRERGVAPTRFIGYETLTAQSRVLGLLGTGDELLQTAGSGAEVRLLADTSPFYAQGGGQVGDRGTVRSATGSGRITNTTQIDSYHLHHVRVESGELSVDQTVELTVDAAARRATERNHTATHLLHSALKSVLGTHVGQAGSEVAPDRLRFDYTHGERPTAQQLAAIEDQVNSVIMQAIPVAPVLKPLADARREGFVAMFGEKYGDVVRTLSVGDFSRELCGGTHVANSGNIGMFRIASEGAISAGTRRIEAVTGPAALQAWRADQRAVVELAQALKVTPAEVVAKVRALGDELRNVRKELERATAADLGQYLRDLSAQARTAGEIRTVVYECRGLNPKEMQDLLQRASQALAPFAGAVLVVGEQEVAVGAAVSEALVGKVRAGDLVRDACKVLGGGGGGRPQLAQGKGADLSRLPEARSLLESRLAAIAGT